MRSARADDRRRPDPRLREELRAAQLAGDVAALDRMLDDELLFTALVSGPLRYTRVWRETPHGWRVVAGHMSAVQASRLVSLPG